ncbi:cytochrome P450 [Caulobacter segnis]|uniref:cytochrome P450 n=1 Tax=Caulobacter segnis TaxID=88688 RepID=UPI00240F4B6E|nr:cytochrome P450 [Caulobacter segnis]MDG2520598.1 cytochrome P450 [Caulobacter segnis]
MSQYPIPQASSLPVVSHAELDANPHEALRRWRAAAPAIERDDGVCIVLRADGVEDLLFDPRTQQLDGATYAAIRGVPQGALHDLLSTSMLLSNAPRHKPRRAPMSRMMSARAIDALRPLIRSLAESLIDEFENDGQVELVSRFAAPLPPLVISHVLGAPAKDAPEFSRWVYQVSPAFSAASPAQDIPRMIEGAENLTRYAEALLDGEPSAAQAGAGLSGLVESLSAGELSPAEAKAQLATVILGGSDTTRTAIASVVALTLAHGCPWSLFASDSQLSASAVSEALRYDPPVGSVPRFSLADIVLDGFTIPAGRMVSLSTLSALRDPHRFNDPDRFDIHRADQPRWPVAFGGGVHRCLGEALARAELEECLMALSRRFPTMRLIGPPPKLRGYAGIRGVDELHLAW